LYSLNPEVMKTNTKKMSSPNDKPFVQSDSLEKNIQEIQSYSLLEEDEDFMPVAQQHIDRAVGVLKAIYAATKRLPFFIVPTRSGGVGIDYKVNGDRAYYHVDPYGPIRYSITKAGRVVKQLSFENPGEAPAFLELVGAKESPGILAGESDIGYLCNANSQIVMDINKERALLIKELERVEDLSLLQAIRAVLHYGLLNSGTISVEQYNREIEDAEARIARGEFVVHEDAINQIKEWRKKDD